MDKVNGLWIYTSALDFLKFCNENNIEFKEWTDEDYNYEVRIDMLDVNRKQIDKLKEYLERDDIDEYTYIIIWN